MVTENLQLYLTQINTLCLLINGLLLEPKGKVPAQIITGRASIAFNKHNTGSRL